jgi:ABC-2 type transport system permease protein
VRAALTGRAWARDLRALLFLLRDLTARNLKIKYQRSALGFVWTLLNPLATTVTLIAVFGGVVRLPVDSYWAFLLSGFFVWNFLHMTLSAGAYVLGQHASVLRSAKVPAEAFILAAVAARLVEFVVELLLVLIAVALFHHHAVPASYALLPVLVLLQVVLVVGLVLPIATIAAFYDDVQHSLPILLLILFYVSPVFYPAALVPAGAAWLYQLNPVAVLLGLYHSVIYGGELPSGTALLDMTLMSLVVCAAGWLVFRRFRGVIAEVL